MPWSENLNLLEPQHGFLHGRVEASPIFHDSKSFSFAFYAILTWDLSLGQSMKVVTHSLNYLHAKIGVQKPSFT